MLVPLLSGPPANNLGDPEFKLFEGSQLKPNGLGGPPRPVIVV